MPARHPKIFRSTTRRPEARCKALRGQSPSPFPRARSSASSARSGCGKSTLISSILRLTAPNARFREGEILFKGQDLLAGSRSPRDAGTARRRHLDRFPRPDADPQSGAPDRHGRWSTSSTASRSSKAEKRASVPPRCWPRSAFPMPKAGSHNIPMNSPAACASASPSPWR